MRENGMRSLGVLSTVLLSSVLLGSCLPCGSVFAADPPELANWHQWRGPLATGEAPLGKPPSTWSEEQNIAWKVEIPGYGSTTPIIWGDRLFVLTSIDTGRVDPALPKPEEQPERPFGIVYPNTAYQFLVLCLNRHTGEELWRRVANERVPHEGHHGDNNYASCSPTTDGERLYCWFGSQGLFCYDLNGELLWQTDLGPVETRRSFGEGSSPVLHQDKLVINRDHEGQSYVVVLNSLTGEELWRKNRDELSTWNTPLVTAAAGKIQVIISATNKVRSYDLDSGELIWECGGQVSNVVPSPVRFAETAICMSGYRGSAAMAIPLDSRGDVTDSPSLRWTLNQGTPYVPSPLLVDGLLYFNQSNNGILTCVDAATGRVLTERTRFPDLRSVYASPVAAGGHLYFTGRDGETVVLKQSPELTRVTTNRLASPIDASPAIVGDALYLRGKQHLYCIREVVESN